MRAMKAIRVAILAASLSVCLYAPAYATGASNGPVSLEQLQEQAENEQAETNATTDSQESNEPQSDDIAPERNSGDSAIADIAGAAKLDTDDPTARRVGVVMNSWAGKAMQIMGYIISIGLGVVVACDLVFISIPPLRGILSNGYTGNVDAAPGNNSANNIGAMGGSPMMGGGYTSMQERRYDMGNQMNNQPANGRLQIVTNAALNAVTSASAGLNPFKVYLKEQLPTIIMAPTIFVLAATGILSRIGFFIGEYITGWLSGLI